AYVNTGNEAYLAEAVNITNWILGEGWETRGALCGIYWNWGAKFQFSGNSRASINTCSTASAAMVFAKLAEVLPGTPYEGLRERYLDAALRLFDFCTEVFVDRANKCLYDNIVLKKGFEKKTERKDQIEKTDTAQYAYNTGTFLTTGADLYKLLHGTDPDRADAILATALASAKGADKKFGDRTVKKGEYSYPSHSWFTSFLVSGFSDLAAYDESCIEYVDHMRSALNYAWANNRSDDGLVCPAWIKGWSRYSAKDTNDINSESNPRQILYQSANAHCYAMLAKIYE
ncbi:MAG: hypothetical protein IKQ87_10860, partial [Clostridia bacterium]|nr:hypothetical protein [Clostridia bacterium]